MRQPCEPQALAYEQPQALRLGQVHDGSGNNVCTLSGSGAADCDAGSAATPTCTSSGNLANLGTCVNSGQDADGYCNPFGNGVTQ